MGGKGIGLVWILLALVAMPALAGERPLRLAPLAMENRAATVKAYAPMAAWLSSALERPVILYYFARYEDAVRAMERGSIDLAVLGPLSYVGLRGRMDGAEPLVLFRESDGSACYRCALVTFAGDGLQLADLRHQPFGLTQPLSTCGYLGADAMLREYAGFSVAETGYRYLGNHERVALAVVSGQVAAGSIKDEFLRKYQALGLEALARSRPLPSIVLVGNGNTLTAGQLAAVRAALLQVPARAYAEWGDSIRHGVVRATDADFDTVRALGDVNAIPSASPGVDDAHAGP